jgi:hypothetical protein
MSETTENLPVQAKASLDFTKLEITSDGTEDGTKILLNGKPITDLTYLNFSFWRTTPMSYSGPISFSFTTSDAKSTPGVLSESCYYSLCTPVPKDGATATRNPATASLQRRPESEIPAEALPATANRQLYAANFK